MLGIKSLTKNSNFVLFYLSMWVLTASDYVAVNMRVADIGEAQRNRVVVLHRQILIKIC